MVSLASLLLSSNDLQPRRWIQELSKIGTPCHLTKPAWTHLKLLKLQSVSNKPPRLLLSFSLFLTYPDARLPLMHSTYLNHCMIFDTTRVAGRSNLGQFLGRTTSSWRQSYSVVLDRHCREIVVVFLLVCRGGLSWRWRLLLSFNLFLTYSDARLPLMHSTYLNHCMIFDTTKEAVNRQKQKQNADRWPSPNYDIPLSPFDQWFK
jgi:hypothetical protein